MKPMFSAAIAAALTLSVPMTALACDLHDKASKAEAAPALIPAGMPAAAATTATNPAPMRLAQAAPSASEAAPAHAPDAHATHAASAAPGAASAGPIRITGAYARSSNPKTGAVFMSIANDGAQACTLAAVQTPASPRAELHTHIDDAGVMKMTKVDHVEIPAGGAHDLARGGDHIMLMDTPAALAEGDEVALTLDFGDCGTVPLTVVVEPAAGRAPAAHDAAAQHGGAADHGSHAAPAN